MPTNGIKLFKLFGIQVYLHPAWFLAVLYFVYEGQGQYASQGWNIADILVLFGIVLTHEFGHALACRSVGGKADRIVLWPLGGVAYVSPPQRPGAVLWSIVAGPLVNVILVPVTFVIAYSSGALMGWLNGQRLSDPQEFLVSIFLINTALLVFNLLPIFPLDGGQILRALLWFVIGQIQSLSVASVIGMVGGGLLLLAAVLLHDGWLILMAGFAAFQSWNGFQIAKKMQTRLEAPLRLDAHCPACGTSPPMLPIWTCNCGQKLDPFATGGICPRCGTIFPTTSCPTCHRASPIQNWYQPVPVQPQP